MLVEQCPQYYILHCTVWLLHLVINIIHEQMQNGESDYSCSSELVKGM